MTNARKTPIMSDTTGRRPARHLWLVALLIALVFSFASIHVALAGNVYPYGSVAAFGTAGWRDWEFGTYFAYGHSYDN